MGAIAGLVIGILVGLLAYYAHLKAVPHEHGGRFACCPRCGILLSAKCAECRKNQRR